MDSNDSGTIYLPWRARRVSNANNGMIYEEQQYPQYNTTATLMSRQESGSSFQTYSSRTTTSTSTHQTLPDSNNPFSPYPNGSSPFSPNTAFDDYTTHVDYSPTSPTFSSMNPYGGKNPLREGQDISKLPLFNIEKDGDPQIAWWMYYTFQVDKDGAYHVLQPGYLATEKYPAKRASETSFDETGNVVYKCRVPQCTSKPFKRPFDLARHFNTVHGQGRANHFFCDYPKCSHTDAFDRKDHCREHYREYHREDLLKSTQKDAAKWLKDRNVVLSWWRCSRCLNRNQADQGWTCGADCNQTCEKGRVEARKTKMKAAKPRKKKTTQTSALQSQMILQGCGYCDNGWFPDEANPHNWVPCAVCQPDSMEVDT